MTTHSANPILGCLAGAALAIGGAMPAHACEGHKAASLDQETAQSTASATVTAMDAWVPVAPPGVKAHAAYLVLMNGGDAPRAVTGVSSPQYASAALHVSKTNAEGVTMMQHLAQIDLPAGTSIVFKPHGLHVMLMGPKFAQKAGTMVDITFTLDDGTDVLIKAEIRPRNEMGANPTGRDHTKHHHNGS